MSASSPSIASLVEAVCQLSAIYVNQPIEGNRGCNEFAGLQETPALLHDKWKACQADLSEGFQLSEWLGTMILNARAISAAADTIPLPYVKGVFGTAVFLLETVDTVQKNREDMKELCADTVDIITIVRDRISSHRDTAAIQFKAQCEELESFLTDVVEAVTPHKRRPRGFSAVVKEVLKSGNTTDEIARWRNRLRDVRSNFMLMAMMDTNFKVDKILTVILPNVPMPQAPRYINNCPPATRIFHGRQAILQQMHQYFNKEAGKQSIFLLHGLGGAGKTQIALKFIEQSASIFTDIFLIDTSTVITIETGFKNIGTTKGVGDSSHDALQWLKSKPDEWLIFFDNADDPNIDLNKYFPQCNHGNIIITSRNPGLCVYASSHSAVSDMEESDAVNLLLRSAAQDSTDHSQAIAAKIVKVLCYLPLAIIQAGAFISNLGG
ncbi:P-loop containing nucleoside triphosphate hydrolase protein [Mycena rosella]|uniref:P-loop containing nucleoside triphosphate hydrolase protein n=1 Tax=Mycena rosella TaxID=1033263 RepID=A0AAD7G2V5_MYCRO|nr:P-loop containing nucleoside triphosphate hydrolase protein [Mycena rosella]